MKFNLEKFSFEVWYDIKYQGFVFALRHDNVLFAKGNFIALDFPILSKAVASVIAELQDGKKSCD